MEKTEKIQTEIKDVDRRVTRASSRMASAKGSALIEPTTRVTTDCSGPDSDSGQSMVSVETNSSRGSSRQRFWRKRPRSTDETRPGSDGACSEDSIAAPKISSAQRGRGRPDKSGEYSGLAKARSEYLKTQREDPRIEEKLRAEREVADLAHSLRMVEESRLETSTTECDNGEEATALAHKKELEDAVMVIRKVSSGSSNLKGTFQKGLNQAAKVIECRVEKLYSHSVTKETELLQTENLRLKAVVDELRKELATMRVDLQALKRPEPVSEGPNILAIMSARFEAIESRLLPEPRLRPLLEADRRRSLGSSPAASAPTQIPAQIASRAGQAQGANTPDASVPATRTRLPRSAPTAPIEGPSNTTVPSGRRKKNRKGKANASQASAPREPRPLPTAPISLDVPWSVVTRRGHINGPRRAAPVASANQAASKPSPRSAWPKLRPPRSSAVVVTLQPDAEKRGITYKEVMTEAKTKIDLESLGIGSVRFKRAATGATLIEVPGTTSGGKADSLASKLREVFKPEDVRVHRPIKCAEMRISGLDDSVTSDEVATAISRTGDCTIQSVKAGEVRQDRRGLGSCWVRCPVEAAKKIVGSKRLLVGWVSATVKLLEPRGLRCFRCLEKGHVREQCSSDVDRSSQCYRCGQVGHKAGTCSAVPHCTICAVAKKPADHMVGSRACKPPRPNRGIRKPTADPTIQPRPARPQIQDEEMTTALP